MKIVLNRQEMEQAFVCFLEKQGVDVNTFEVKISVNEATISLNPDKETAIVVDPLMKSEPPVVIEAPVDETAETEQVSETPAVAEMFGSFGEPKE